jgi:prepilin-type N-terminal cleavage/methylation domain-containing protein
MTHTSPRRAFTLIEILTVVGILALLVAILLPALRTARRNAEWADAANNLRQVSTYLQAYIRDAHAVRLLRGAQPRPGARSIVGGGESSAGAASPRHVGRHPLDRRRHRSAVAPVGDGHRVRVGVRFA